MNKTFGEQFDIAFRYCLNQAVRGSPFVLMMWRTPKGVKWNKIMKKNCCCVAYGNLGTAAQSSKMNAPKRLSQYWSIFVYEMPRLNYVAKVWKRASLISKIRPFTPMRHEDRALQKPSCNQRNFKSPALRLSVDEKHFENQAFKNRWHDINHLISLNEFS